LTHYIWNQAKGHWVMVRVLVVDGEAVIRKLLTQWLKGWGYDAFAVAGADEALVWMRLTPADIVIADCMMPEHDGIWLLHQIREHWPRTIVIMENGAGDLETSLRGAFDHLPTPLNPDLLHEAVERARRAIGPPTGQPATSPPPGASKPPAES
jgi:DNA-binding NtrC family response regulator